MKQHILTISLLGLALSVSAGGQAAGFIEFEGVEGESRKEAQNGGISTGKRQQPLKPVTGADGQQAQQGPVLKVKAKGVQAEANSKVRVKPAPLRGIEPDEIDNK